MRTDKLGRCHARAVALGACFANGIHTLAPEWIPEYSGMTIVKNYVRGKLAPKDECFWPNSYQLVGFNHSE